LEYLYNLIRGEIEFLESSEQLYHLLTADINFKGMLKQHPLTDDTLVYTQQLTNSRSDFIQLLQKSQKYQVALREWQTYQRGKEIEILFGAEMERTDGFDLKHGMHCIRLLRSGLEILRQVKVIVNRYEAGDADELKAILKGEYSYEQVMKTADELVAQINVVDRQSTLP
jgi:hypothetical protein